MKVNGISVTSGTIIASLGQSVEIDLPSGPYEIVFNDAAPAQSAIIKGSKIHIDNLADPFGVVLKFIIQTASGPKQLTLAVYTVGGGNLVDKIIHYTVEI